MRILLQSAVPQQISLAFWGLHGLQFLQVYLLLLWPWCSLCCFSFLLVLSLSVVPYHRDTIWWAHLCPAVGLVEPAGVRCACHGSAPHLFTQTHPCSPASANNLLQTPNATLKSGKSVNVCPFWPVSFGKWRVLLTALWLLKTSLNRRAFCATGNCPVQFKACSGSPSLHPLSYCVPAELLFVLKPWGFGQVAHSWISWHSYLKAIPAFPTKKRYRALS